MYEEIWLTQQGVVNGNDDVVEAAINWINSVSSVEECNDEIVMDYHLSHNFPNPFNPTTTIKYYLPKSTNVVIKIYDVIGQEITTLFNEYQTIGWKSIIWDGADNFGNTVGSGIYLYRIQAGNIIQSRKMLFLK